MTFTKRLRDGVRRGEITCSVRIWTRPHVRVGGRYRMEEGEIEVDTRHVFDPLMDAARHLHDVQRRKQRVEARHAQRR